MPHPPGGGGEPRELEFGLTDMERIDPDAVTAPAWYRPNSGRAEDLAFVLFTGAGERTRINRITNRRWALSAHGTAAAAALSEADTVYSITPIHHPSGLLTSIGGAVAGGARLALASSFDTATFWSEVRRYGVTIVSYTWTLCRDLVEAPPSAGERHHPVRLFVGSGMPAGLWRRVLDRFAPAGVLEFYASTEGEAVLGNTFGRKVGSKGRPLPGSADVAVATYDVDAGRLVEREDGFAVRCGPGEVGMLLARVDRERGHTGATPLRGVFARGDAWLATGDLFEVDEDGGHWWVDDVVSLVHTARGAVGTVPLPEHHRPVVVHVIETMPRTTWFRPRKVVLRQAGLPDDDARGWAWDPTRTGTCRSTRPRWPGSPTGRPAPVRSLRPGARRAGRPRPA